MKNPLSLVPAPPRGKYDRRQPRELRVAEQRERLLHATAVAFAERDAPSLSEIVALAGTGRNTFYEYFDDVPHAARETVAAAERRIDAALRRADERTHTSRARWTALARVWFEFARSRPAEMSLLARPAPDGGLSRGGRVWESALVRSVSLLSARETSSSDESVPLTAAAAAAEVLGRACAHAAISRPTVNPIDAGELSRWERGLVEVTARLLLR